MIVIHEAGGLGEHIRDVCNRLAEHRLRDARRRPLHARRRPAATRATCRRLMARLFSMSDATALGDLEGAADHLRSLDGVSGRIGCIGFCMGGRYTLLFACASSEARTRPSTAGAASSTAPRPRSARPSHARLRRSSWSPSGLECPLLAAVGAEDHNPSPRARRATARAGARSPAGRSGQEVKVDVYDGAGHAFFADYRPSYRPEPAAKLWTEIVPFLARHLQSG